MINGKTTRETLREHLTDDAGLLKDFAEVAAFGAVIVAGGPLAPAAFVALVLKTAGASIAAATRVLGRLGDSGDPATHRLPNTYERFRAMFYVACQRAYLGAIESNFATLSKLAKKSKVEKSALEHARKALEQTVVQIDEAEVRFRYSLDPADEPLPLFKAYGEWVSAALVVAMPDYGEHSAFVSRVQADAIKRLHVALAADEDAAIWMRRYLALQRDSERTQAVRTDLASIRHALDGWLEVATGKRQREEAWRSYREMLQALPDARETMFNEEFGVRKVFVAPRVKYHRAGMSESGEEPATVPDLGTIFGALLSTRVSGDDLIILSGGPGSGKSTLCRLLASELAKNSEIHPIFLRLRRFKEGGDLSSFLAETLENAGLIGKLPDLQFLPNVVVILDGFDELVMASRARLRQFFRALLDDVQSGPLRKAKVLVSGRDTLFPRGEGLPRGSHVLTLLPFDKPRVEVWGEKWRRLHPSGPGSTFKPEALIENPKKPSHNASPLQHLVTWPLTLHLVARTHTAGKLDISATKSAEIQKAYLYRSILADTSARQINQTDGKGRMEPSRMRQFLRSLAWEMHARAVDSMDIADVNTVLRSFYPDASDADLTELSDVTIVNQPELQKAEDKGFEFVHKSFAEYLVAELVASNLDAVTYRVPEPDGTLAWRQNRREACRSLATLFSPRPLSAEIREMIAPMLGAFSEFVRDERMDKTERRGRVDGLQQVLERCQELYNDFFSQDALATVAQMAPSVARQQHTLQLYANYAAGVVTIATTAVAELRRETDGKSAAQLHAEPFDGAFWRWLFIVSGWSPVGADATRLLDGVSVQRREREASISESSCPIRFAALERVTGYDSEFRSLLEQADMSMYALIEIVFALSSLIVRVIEPQREPELVRQIIRDLLVAPLEHYEYLREDMSRSDFVSSQRFRGPRYLMDDWDRVLRRFDPREMLSHMDRDRLHMGERYFGRTWRALEYLTELVQRGRAPS